MNNEDIYNNKLKKNNLNICEYLAKEETTTDDEKSLVEMKKDDIQVIKNDGKQSKKHNNDDFDIQTVFNDDVAGSIGIDRGIFSDEINAVTSSANNDLCESFVGVVSEGDNKQGFAKKMFGFDK